MVRRDFLGGLLSTSAMAPIVPASALAASLAALGALSDDAINVAERFGFVPDGRTDNYAAFHRWADFVNQARGGNYIFPPGEYFVRQHRTRSLALRDPREVINPLIIRCDSLTVSGYGAKIRLNGAFHRSGKVGRDGKLIGQNMALFMPFEIHLSNGVKISGFEMDGGVREMSRDQAVNEIYAGLIALHGCTNVTLQDLDLHHCQTDAIYLTSSRLNEAVPGIACRNITLSNVKCHNNARGGMGVIQVYGLLCTDCAFDQNGVGLGKYLPHAPRFGIDVEPDHVHPRDVDMRTGNIEFRRCSFMDNGSAFLAGYADRYRGYLRLIDCKSSNQGGGPHHMIINWPGALVQGGRHDAGNGTIWTSWQGPKGGDLIIRDCELRSSGGHGGYGIFHAYEGNIVRFEQVKLIGTHRQAEAAGTMVAIQADPGGGRRNSLTGCEIFVPAARKGREHPYDYEVSLRHTISEGNLFRTDLSGTGGQHFCTEYGPGTIARRDRYQGTAPGRQDSFRPVHMSQHDTRSPYASG